MTIHIDTFCELFTPNVITIENSDNMNTQLSRSKNNNLKVEPHGKFEKMEMIIDLVVCTYYQNSLSKKFL